MIKKLNSRILKLSHAMQRREWFIGLRSSANYLEPSLFERLVFSNNNHRIIRIDDPDERIYLKILLENIPSSMHGYSYHSNRLKVLLDIY